MWLQTSRVWHTELTIQGSRERFFVWREVHGSYSIPSLCKISILCYGKLIPSCGHIAHTHLQQLKTFFYHSVLFHMLLESWPKRWKKDLCLTNSEEVTLKLSITDQHTLSVCPHSMLYRTTWVHQDRWGDNPPFMSSLSCDQDCLLIEKLSWHSKKEGRGGQILTTSYIKFVARSWKHKVGSCKKLASGIIIFFTMASQYLAMTKRFLMVPYFLSKSQFFLP